MNPTFIRKNMVFYLKVTTPVCISIYAVNILHTTELVNKSATETTLLC